MSLTKRSGKTLEDLFFGLTLKNIARKVVKTETILFKTKNKNYDENLNLKSAEKGFVDLLMLNILELLSMKT